MTGRKMRTPIPNDVAAEVLYRSDRTCCVCREPRKPVQIHHLDEDPSHNDPDNLAVLCLECHDDTQLRGGFGRKLNADLVRLYRDEWLALVDRRRNPPPPGAPPPPLFTAPPLHRIAHFVGREAELERLRADLRAGGVHFVSGMGGVGKTALATRLAHELRAEFPGGVL
jgi:hypothetical protein